MIQMMLKLEIGGHWEPQDFIEVFQAIESFYYKLAHEPSYRFDPPFWPDEVYAPWTGGRIDVLPYTAILDRLNGRMLERARHEAPFSERLNVVRIHYASPGGIDLLGIGKVVE